MSFSPNPQYTFRSVPHIFGETTKSAARPLIGKILPFVASIPPFVARRVQNRDFLLKFV